MKNLARSDRKTFLADARGNAAVEFAFISVVLMALVAGVVEVSMIAYDRTDMYAATRAGAQYFMAGGNDFERAAAIVQSSWTERPPDGQIVVSRYCECGGVEAVCFEPCGDGNPPDAFARIQTFAVFDGILQEYTNEAADIVRIR